MFETAPSALWSAETCLSFPCFGDLSPKQRRAERRGKLQGRTVPRESGAPPSSTATSRLRKALTSPRTPKAAPSDAAVTLRSPASEKLSSSPAGRKIIAQRFNAGLTASKCHQRPSGAAEARHRRSPLSSLTGIGLVVALAPSIETLGYSRTSLRDWAAPANWDRACNRRKIPLAQNRDVVATFPVSRTFQLAFSQRVLA